jgi:hypothetical protein
MASTYTNLGLELMATGENAGTWGTKTNSNLSLIEQLTGGFSTLSIAGGANTTDLTVIDGTTTGTAQYRMIEFTGTITGNQIVTIPLDVETFYFLRNSTTGSFTVQFKYVTGSGTSSTFASTDKGDKLLFAAADDGTNPNIKEISLASPPGGSDTQIQFNDGGTAFGGSANLVWDGTDIIAGSAKVSDLTSGRVVTAGTSGAIEDSANLTFDGSNLTIGAQGDLRLADTTGGEYVGLQAPTSVSASYTLTFPAATGTADQILVTDGSGNLSFVDNSGGTDWQAVKTADFNAVAGEGYFVDTNSVGAVTMTLPASPTIGDEVAFIDYAGTFDTNNLTVGRNSENIQGSAADLTVSTERAANTLVYTDGTQGWLLKVK